MARIATGNILTPVRLNEGRVVKGVNVTNTGNPIATTVSTTELDLAKLTLSGLTLTANRYYRARYMVTFTKTVVTDTFDFRLRANTAVSGTQVGQTPIDPTDGRGGGYRFIEFLFKGNASWTSLFISVLRTAGSGTLSYYGTSGGFNRAHGYLVDLGDSGNWSDVA